MPKTNFNLTGDIFVYKDELEVKEAQAKFIVLGGELPIVKYKDYKTYLERQLLAERC